MSSPSPKSSESHVLLESSLRRQIAELTTENLRLRHENSELRSQLDWHPIGPEVRPQHASSLLPIEAEQPPPVSGYVRDHRAQLG